MERGKNHDEPGSMSHAGKCTDTRSPASPERGAALIITLALIVLCVVLAVAFLTSVTTSGVDENAGASENNASQFAATAVQLVEGTITDATTTGTYPTVAWACQPGMIRTYGAPGGINGSIIASGSALAYYKLYSANNMVVTNTQDMNPNDIFSGDVPANWDADPAIYTDLNAPIRVAIPNATSASASTAMIFPIVDPRAADSDIAVQGFSYSPTMTGSGGTTYSIPGVINTGTTGVYANDTTSRLPMPVAWMYVLKDGAITVPPPLPLAGGGGNQAVWGGSVGGIAFTGTNGPTSSNPIVGRIAFWTDDECGKVNVNTASEGTYWDTPIANSGTATGVFSSGTVPIGDVTLADIEPAQHEYQRYPGHPATTCLSAVFGNALARSGLARADIVKAITDAVPRISDYGQGAATYYSPPNGSVTTTMGGTVVSSTAGAIGSVITDTDRLYASLDEFQFQPNRKVQNIEALMSATAALAEQNDVDTCRFFLTAHSKAPELNMFGLPRVSIWPLWDTSQHGTLTVFDSEILRCSTVNASGTNPHQMCFFRYNPASPTLDYPTAALSRPAGPTVARNTQVYGYLQALMNMEAPGFGYSFAAKYGSADTNQILTEIFDYIRCTNLADNSTGAMPYTSGSTGASTAANNSGLGQVVPIQIPATTGTTCGLGRIATIQELGLELIKVDDRANTAMADGTANITGTISVIGAPGITGLNPHKQTLIEWSLIPMLASPMAGYVGEANNLRIRFSNINLNIGGQSVTAATTGVLSDLYSTGQIGGGLDNRMGGLIGPTALTVRPAPSDSLYPTGLIVVNGTSAPAGAQPIDLLPSPGISGSVTATIYATAGTYAQPGPVVQTISFVFPPTPAPVPRLAIGGIIPTGGTNQWWGTMRAPNIPAYVGGVASSTFTYPSTTLNTANATRLNAAGYNLADNSADVLRTLIDTGTMSGSSIAGDLRLVAISGKVPATTFQPSAASSSGAPPSVLQVSGSSFVEGTMRWGKGLVVVPGFSLFGFCSLVPTIAVSAYGNEFGPDIPPETLGPNGPGAGDWDNGPGMMVDGPWANKPDEGMYAGAGGSLDATPYIGDYQVMNDTAEQLTTLFSPNRQISSPVMFGSLPVGPDHPWQTLLFRPATLPGYHGTYTHPGNPYPNLTSTETLPDHLLLDLFWMPIVEPYGISEPLATSGKINLNYEIAPFTYIDRQTGLDAVLKSVMITALNPNITCNGGAGPFSQFYKGALVYSGGESVSNPNVSTRYPIDATETLNQLLNNDQANTYPEFGRGSNTLANPNFFVSATQICDVPLIPLGYTSANLSTFWTNNSLTGDNSLERPYSLIYPRVTTKSNIFTVHVIAQSLRQTPADLQSGVWTENVDQVTSEFRGAFTIEKYYDPNNSDLSYYADRGLAAWPASSDGAILTSGSTVSIRGVKWRILGVKRFGQ